MVITGGKTMANNVVSKLTLNDVYRILSEVEGLQNTFMLGLHSQTDKKKVVPKTKLINP